MPDPVRLVSPPAAAAGPDHGATGEGGGMTETYDVHPNHPIMVFADGAIEYDTSTSCSTVA